MHFSKIAVYNVGPVGGILYKMEAAAKFGAVAMLLRSVASFSINSPHTGSMRYDSTVAKIPAAPIAVSVPHA